MATLGEGLAATVANVIPRGERVALIDFPNHGNVGDSAIWLGELELLRNSGARLVYSCETEGYGERALRRRLAGAGTILLHGGGNLGDAYPGYQELREQVIEAFPERRIVQLPQSISFADERNVERARAAFDSHPDLVLLCRDARSLAFARREFRARSELCADAAVALGPLRPSCEPSTDVLWLSRTDAERRSERLDSAGAPGERTVDWLGESRGNDGWTPAYGALRAVSRRLGARATRRSRVHSPTLGATEKLHRSLAAMRLRYGIDLLSSARVVVTDRLHAHLLCLLLDIPHVVVDTGYGKIDGFLDAWTGGYRRVRKAAGPEEAKQLAAELLAQEATR